MLVLGVETSCDETAIALYHSQQGLLASEVYSQIALHKQFGGVVPELASRDHQRKIMILIDSVLLSHRVKIEDIDLYAYTAGPGLSGALLTGAMVATTLAFSQSKPAIAVNHMEGHLLSPMLSQNINCTFPFIALLVSGGHTELIYAKSYRNYQKLGDTLDDAAGETFDKVAVMLGLDYPGGPEIAKLAAQCEHIEVADNLKFPLPMVNRPGLDFSFSGLKTHTLNVITEFQKKKPLSLTDKTVIAYAFQNAVVKTLSIKCLRAILKTNCRNLILSGGVASNQQLRQYLPQFIAKKADNVNIMYPELKFCTDNAAMIALAGLMDYQKTARYSYSIKIKPRWSIDTLDASS